MNALLDEKNKAFEVLLIEDNQADIVLVQEALKEVNKNIRLSVVKDGEEALDYLHKKKIYTHVSNPDLVILDINLPRKGGFEVLQIIKEDPGLKPIPVVVFTSSGSQKDILRTYGLGGLCMLTKPLGFYEFMESIKSITSSFLK